MRNRRIDDDISYKPNFGIFMRETILQDIKVRPSSARVVSKCIYVYVFCCGCAA
jgi:hypothetical protein